MNASRQELFELLALRATEGLGPAEDRTLNQLFSQHPAIDEDGFERAAAAIHLALLGPEKPLPAGLRGKILADWKATHATADPSATEKGARSSTARYGWWAAAAALLIALLGWWPRWMEPTPRARPLITESTAPAVPASPADLREALLGRTVTLTLPWSGTDDAASAGASGDVVWSSGEQAGFMRIVGLEANDPAQAQYQLWIFDRLRDERYPVDGGVFDMPAGGGEAIVAIEATVSVGEPYLFAVTVEQPGGVVVSSRERIVLVAQG